MKTKTKIEHADAMKALLFVAPVVLTAFYCVGILSQQTSGATIEDTEGHVVQQADTVSLSFTAYGGATNYKFQPTDAYTVGVLGLYGDAMTNLPRSFNLKDQIDLVVSDQMTLDTCAIFSSTKSIETNYALSHGQYIDLSERYLDYMSSSEMYGQRTVGFFSESSGDGAAIDEIMAIAESYGVASETELPYFDNYTSDQVEAAETVVRVTSAASFPNIEEIEDADLQANWINIAKAHIMKYGSLQASIAAPSSDNTDWNNGAYYYVRGVTASAGGHGISIVGWDDDYPRSNFSYFEGMPSGMPSSDGAFIILNSWGESSGDGGYLYVSYESDGIVDQLMGVLSTEDAQHVQTYSYDNEIFNNSGFTPSHRFYGVKYNTSDTEQYLSSVVFGAGGFSQQLFSERIRVYLNPIDSSFDADKLVLLQDTHSVPLGYYSVASLDIPIPLTEDSYALVFELVGELDDILAISSTGDGEMYYADSLTGSWALSDDIFTVRAFTVQNMNMETVRHIDITGFKTEYEISDELEINTGYMSIQMDNGRTINVPLTMPGVIISGYDALNEGAQVVTFTYGSYTTQKTVTVINPSSGADDTSTESQTNEPDDKPTTESQEEEISGSDKKSSEDSDERTDEKIALTPDTGTMMQQGANGSDRAGSPIMLIVGVTAFLSVLAYTIIRVVNRARILRWK